MTDLFRLAVEAASRWGAVQVPAEVEMFVGWLIAHHIQSVLEIGTMNGGTAAMFLALGCRVVSIDLPDGSYGGLPQAVCEYRNRQLTNYGDFTGILGDSTHAETITHAKAFAPYDLVFIDGNHTRSGVLADIEHYRPMARYLALHDITAGPNDYGVPAVWATLPPPKIELVQPLADWGGIGIAW